MPPPDRWDNYTTVGDRIKNTRFIAFKVPLKPALCKNLTENERFTPQNLLDRVRNNGHDLKLVIDLTNTAKYYNPTDITDNGVQHKKFYTAGHEVPNADVVRRFTNEVDGFLANNADAETLIGVHCTHGVNRSGYLICRYMIDRLGFVPEDAVEAFALARGHPIERVTYIDALKAGKVNDGDEENSRRDEKRDTSRPHREIRGYRERDYDSDFYDNRFNNGGYRDNRYAYADGRYQYNPYSNHMQHDDWRQYGIHPYNNVQYFDDRQHRIPSNRLYQYQRDNSRHDGAFNPSHDYNRPQYNAVSWGDSNDWSNRDNHQYPDSIPSYCYRPQYAKQQGNRCTPY